MNMKRPGLYIIEQPHSASNPTSGYRVSRSEDVMAILEGREPPPAPGPVYYDYQEAVDAWSTLNRWNNP